MTFTKPLPNPVEFSTVCLYLPKLSGEASPPALFIQSDSLTSAECRGFAPRIFEKTRLFHVLRVICFPLDVTCLAKMTVN